MSGQKNFCPDFFIFFVPDGYRDLGLPSRLLWANKNYGANYSYNYGNYYAWCETSPKSNYTWNNYDGDDIRWLEFGGPYTVDDMDAWDSEYFSRFSDATDKEANLMETVDYDGDNIYDTYYVGYYVGVPSKYQFKELIDNCTMSETTSNGIKGVKFTSKRNGNSIFLPYGGSCYDGKTRKDGTASYYWTYDEDVNDSQKAYAVSLKSGTATITTCQKRTGLPLRLCAKYSGLFKWEFGTSNNGQFSETDGISNMKTQSSTDDSIYTLQGVKVEGTPQPGIYVKNGRKVVVK